MYVSCVLLSLVSIKCFSGRNKSANFFLYVCNGKKVKELFASTLNGVTGSVRCVSSIIVVLNVKLTRLIAAHANKKDGEKRKSSKSAVFCKHMKILLLSVLTPQAKTNLLYTFQRSMQANKNINLW